MKVKLILVDSFEARPTVPAPSYFITGGHLERWVYSPPDSPKCVETIFG
jgi:small subunit ribosomal protein S1